VQLDIPQSEYSLIPWRSRARIHNHDALKTRAALTSAPPDAQRQFLWIPGPRRRRVPERHALGSSHHRWVTRRVSSRGGAAEPGIQNHDAAGNLRSASVRRQDRARPR
jgi:hypothetical protein